MKEFYKAIVEGDLKLVETIIEKGANVNEADTIGRTPLYIACSHDHAEIAELLIEKGANVNVANREGITALDMMYLLGAAPLKGYIELAKLFINSILLKNIEEKKPPLLQGNGALAAYWDEQVEKINYLSKKELLASKTLTETILTKISSGKNDTLVSYSFHQLFKSLNPKSMKNNVSNEADQALLNMNMTPSPKLG